MKYLVKHRKRFALAVAVVVMSGINVFEAIREKRLTQDIIYAFVLAVATLLGLFYNMPTSEENHIATLNMESEKRGELPRDYFESEGEDYGEDGE